jgi:tetratricopeptide (TPR) repeat protein
VLRGLLLAIGLLGLAACQQTPAPGVVRTPEAPPGPMTRQLKEAGDALLAKGEYAAAALKFQQALNQEPADLALRFGLGTALSYLDRRDETAQQFQWVVSRGRPDSEEVRLARRWLVRAGYPVETLSVQPAGVDRKAERGTAVSKSKVKGRTEWPGVDPRERMIPLRITLAGEEMGNRDVTISRRFRLGKPYELWNVPPGKFRLTARAGGTTLWDRSVAVEAGQDTILDLTSASSPISPRDFPSSFEFGEE